MKKAKKLHQTVLTELGDGRIFEDKKRKGRGFTLSFRVQTAQG